LCLDYGWPVATQAMEIVPPAVAIGALVALTAWTAYRRPEWGFLFGWFFLILAPTSSVVPIVDLAVEHRMYLPLAAVVALLVMVAYHALHTLLTRFAGDQVDRSIVARLVPAALLLALVAVLASRTALRNEDYHSSLSIWQDTLHKRPQNRRAEVNVRIAIEELELARTIQLHGAGTPLVGDQ
jgi:hypothetical protein